MSSRALVVAATTLLLLCVTARQCRCNSMPAEELGPYDIEPWKSIEPFKIALIYYKDVLRESRWIWAPAAATATGLFQNVVVMSRLFSSGYTGNATLVVTSKDLVMIEIFDITSEAYLLTRRRHGQTPILRASIGGFLSVVGEFKVPLLEGRTYDLRFNVISFMHHQDKACGLLFALHTPGMRSSIVSNKQVSTWSRTSSLLDE